MTDLRFKASETLLGIETKVKAIYLLSAIGFKASETLLGIETAPKPAFPRIQSDSKPLKPF